MLRTLVIGAKDQVEEPFRMLRKTGSGYLPLAWIDSENPILATPDISAAQRVGRVRIVFRRYRPDCVFLASTTIGSKQMCAVMQAARQEGVVVKIYTDLSGVWASRLAAHPLIAAYLHAVAIWFWHTPYFYMLAVENPWWHLVEHACFLAAGWVLWWTAARAGGPAGWGPGALAVFVSLFPLTVLGFGLLFSRTTWYARHHDLVDQQVGGVVMWAGGGLLALVGAVALAVAWISDGAAQSASSRTS